MSEIFLSLMGFSNEKKTAGKKVNIELKIKTHTQAKLISVLKQITLNRYLQKAIEEAVEKDKEIIEGVMK